MGSSGLLVRVPAYPYCLQMFTPDRPLAVLAAELGERGHSVGLRDYCRVSTFEAALGARGRLSGVRKSAEAVEARVIDVVVDDLRKAGLRPDYVVFRIDHPRQAAAVERIGRRVWKSDRRPVIVGWAPGLIGADVRRISRAFDTFTHDPRGLATALERLKTGDRLQPVDVLAAASRKRSPLPSYGASAYPGLSGGEMLRIFSLDASASIVDNRRGCTTAARGSGVTSTVREMKHVLRAAGTGAFRIHCGAGHHSDRLAIAIRANGLRVAFSCSGTVAQFTAQSLADLAGCGCRAVSVQADSGSQYLLDEFYGSPWTVTEMERVLRASRFHDLYTVGEFTYPCPRDDYHTRAETERIVRRSQPHAVRVAPLEPAAAKRAERRACAALVTGFQERGLATETSAELALMADLAGHKGDEAAFRETVERQFDSMDVGGLRATIERINQGIASTAPAAESASSHLAFRDAIGN